MGRHRANRPKLLFSVEYTPQSRLSPFGFKRGREKQGREGEREREREEERSKARVVSRRASCNVEAC